MAGKRGQRVPPPPPPGGWSLYFVSGSASDDWNELCDQFPNATRRAFDSLEADPFGRTDRQHRLRGKDGSTTIRGRTLEQWQYEVTGAARILYAPDPDSRVVWVIAGSTGHPKRTERVRG